MARILLSFSLLLLFVGCTSSPRPTMPTYEPLQQVSVTYTLRDGQVTVTADMFEKILNAMSDRYLQAEACRRTVDIFNEVK